MRIWLGLLIPLTVSSAAAFGFGIGAGVVSDRISDDFSGTIALGGVTLIATTGLALWQFQRTKRKEAEARIFALRSPIYEKLVHVIRDLLLESKGWTPPRSPDELAKELSFITYDMVVWGGKDTVKSLMRISEMPADDAAASLKIIANLFRSIRKDLGHDDDPELPNDLVSQLITPTDRQSVRNMLKS